jgi:hypothetical protein
MEMKKLYTMMSSHARARVCLSVHPTANLVDWMGLSKFRVMVYLSRMISHERIEVSRRSVYIPLSQHLHIGSVSTFGPQKHCLLSYLTVDPAIRRPNLWSHVH